MKAKKVRFPFVGTVMRAEIMIVTEFQLVFGRRKAKEIHQKLLNLPINLTRTHRKGF
jgi:hypothetical protein